MGPHRTTALDAIELAARGASCPINLGLRRGLGRIFGSSEGGTVYAGVRPAFTPGARNEVQTDKSREANQGERMRGNALKSGTSVL